MHKITAILVASWFLLWGVLNVTNVQVDFAKTVLGFLAIAITISIAVTTNWKG